MAKMWTSTLKSCTWEGRPGKSLKICARGGWVGVLLTETFFFKVRIFFPVPLNFYFFGSKDFEHGQIRIR